MADRQSRTLFVRNLPFSASNELLTKVFGEIGPIKTAFVVKDKGSDKCKGYGYVKFSMLEDAVKAKEEVKLLDGRKIFCAFANAKRTEKKKHKGKTVVNETASDSENADETPKKSKKEDKPKKSKQEPSRVAEEDGDGGGNPKAKNSKFMRIKTVAVHGLEPGTTLEKLQQMIKDVKHVAEVTFPVNGQENAAHLRFKCVRDAERAVRRLTGMKLQAARLAGRSASASDSNVFEQKKARLIVRNLSFKCKSEDLQKEFSKYGDVQEVKIPTKPGGGPSGFGFVLFSTLDEAKKALENMNSKKILGRPVVVDWALPKTQYFGLLSKAPSGTGKHDSDDESSSSEEDEESTSPNPVPNAQKMVPEKQRGVKRKAEPEEEDSEESDDKSDSAISSGKEEGEDDDSDSDDDNEDSGDADSDMNSEESGGDSDISGDEDEDESNEDEEDSGTDGEVKKKKKQKQKTDENRPKVQRPSDVEEGRTVFVRNVPFEAEEEELEEVFEEFGQLVYTRLVMDKQTERPKGTAFVQYFTKEAADRCLEKAQEEGKNAGITLHGRKLLVTQALSRTEVQNQKQMEKTKEKKDSRNLFLAREGMIRPGTEAAADISQEDMAKRMRIVQLKRERLKNQNIFASSTRLCVHNLPTKVDEKELRKVIVQIVEDPAAQITECRVMRDRERANAAGVGKSLGYAFVNFTQHEHALKALRGLNNSEVFGPKKRPIVEFSLENRKALELQQKRKEKNKVKIEKGKQATANPQKQQDRIARAQHKGPTGLPKHFGPKVRHRDRNKGQTKGKGKFAQKASSKDKQQKKKGFKQQHQPQKSERTKPLKKKARMTDAFDSLVSKYKEKISKGSKKWFET